MAEPIREFAEPFPISRTTERPLTLETVLDGHAQAYRSFYRRRPPLRTQICGRVVTIQAAWTNVAEIPSAEQQLIRLSIDGREGSLLVPAALTEALLGGVDASLAVAALSPEQAALILELAIEDALARIEAKSGHRIELQSLARGAALPRAQMVVLALSLDVQGLGRSVAWLTMTQADTVALAPLLDAAAGLDKAAIADLAVPLSVRVAAASPTIGELASLRLGDVMLVDDACGDAVQAVAVIAEHLVFSVDLIEPGIRLLSRPIIGNESAWEWSMDKVDKGIGTVVPGGFELDDLPVRVLFEIGRLDLPIGELRCLDVGATLPLARGADNAVDIMVSGKRIGRGALIKIGESVGVRITRLFDHG